MLTKILKATYTSSQDALYVHLSSRYPDALVSETFPVGPTLGLGFASVNLDFSRTQKLVGIEVLDASSLIFDVGQLAVICEVDAETTVATIRLSVTSDEPLTTIHCTSNEFGADFYLSRQRRLVAVRVPNSSRWLPEELLAD